MLLDALCFWSRRSLHEFEVITYYINYIISIHNSHYVSFLIHSLHQADWRRWYTKFFGTFALGHSRIKLVWSIEWLSTFSSQVWGKWLCRNVGSWCLHPRMKRSTTYPIWSKSSDWVDRINLECRKNGLEIFQAIQWSTNGIYLIHDVITPFVRWGWPPSSCPLIWHLAFSPFFAWCRQPRASRLFSRYLEVSTRRTTGIHRVKLGGVVFHMLSWQAVSSRAILR